MTINIYTDGAYRSSSEIGSWAFAIYSDDELTSYHSQALEEVTNQQAEMLAVIHSLKHLEDKETPAEDVYLHSDSAYVVNCIDRKSTRLNSSHVSISYAVFCYKKKRQCI